MKNRRSSSGSPPENSSRFACGTDYQLCALCPRECGVNRKAGEKGYCGQTERVKLAASVIHFGEEPPLVGKGGSGTLFFSGCTLKCSFCQNHQISAGAMGRRIENQELADIFLLLQEKGAENINLITGTHFTPGIIDALDKAKGAGLTLPVVWNSSGFESIETLEKLNPYIDVYLPDLKTVSANAADTLYSTPEYADAAKNALLWMAGHKPRREENGILTGGVIVRHLVLPGFTEVTEEVLRWFRENLYERTVLSLMFQYTPPGMGKETEEGILPARPVSAEEHERIVSLVDDLGIEEGFIQELEEESEWSPDFTRYSPFPSAEAVTVWHWDRKAGE